VFAGVQKIYHGGKLNSKTFRKEIRNKREEKSGMLGSDQKKAWVEVDLVQSCREENTQKININRASWCQHGNRFGISNRTLNENLSRDNKMGRSPGHVDVVTPGFGYG